MTAARGTGPARVVVEADGGARGNPGPAGYGALVRDPDSGEVLAERSASLGTATNNVAEYSGLLAGLEAAAELGARAVDVRMDSKLVVEQMSGRWQIKHPGLRPLAARAAALIREFDQVSFAWIPRSRNAHADALANAAMDAAAKDRPGPAAGPGRRAGTGRGGGADPGGADPGGSDPGGADRGGVSPAAGDAATASAATAGRQPAGAAHPPPGTHDPAASRGAAAGGSAVAGSRNAAAVAGGSTAAGSRAPVAGVPASGGSAAGVSWEPPTGVPTRFILVRHGETALTAQRRYSGRGDVPLSERGRDQARAVAARIARIDGVAGVVSSPLARCAGTAALIADALGAGPPSIEPDLIECDFGAWEGRTFAEIRQGWPDEMRAWMASTDVAPPGGESLRAVAERVHRAANRLVRRYPGRAVVVVTHVSPIKLLLRDALGAGDTLLHRLYLDPTGVSTMDTWPSGQVAVRTVNETAHLAS